MTDPNSATPTPSPEPTASPTGTPILPPSIARWATIVVVAALAGLGSAVAMWPEVKALQVALAITTAIAAVLGIASPGLRRAAVVLLCLAPMALGGCIHLKPGADKQMVKCGTDAMQAQAAAVLPDVAKAIGGSAVDWQPQLDELVARVGGAALCALAVLVANLEVGGGAGAGVVPSTGPRPPDSVLLMRGYAYQAAHPYQLE